MWWWIKFYCWTSFANSIENHTLYLNHKINYEDIPKIYHKFKSNLINLKNLSFTREGLGNLNLRFLLIWDSSFNREIYYLSAESHGYNNKLNAIGLDLKK